MVNDSDLSLTILKELKTHLRQQKIRYQDIATALCVSLPTVKRLLSKPGIPFDSLAAICKLTGVAVSELIAQAEKELATHTFFTTGQDKLFYEEPWVLSYFQHLYYLRKTPEEIEQEFKLTNTSSHIYLIKLEKVKLIRLLASGQIHFLVSPPLGFGPDSLIIKQNQKFYIDQLIQKNIEQPKEKNKGFYFIKPLQLNLEQYETMLLEIKAIVDKFAYLSEAFLTNNKDKNTYAIMTMAAVCDPKPMEEIRELSAVQGS